MSFISEALSQELKQLDMIQFNKEDFKFNQYVQGLPNPSDSIHNLEKEENKVFLNCENCAGSLTLDHQYCQYCGSINPNIVHRKLNIEVCPTNQSAQDVAFMSFQSANDISIRNIKKSADDIMEMMQQGKFSSYYQESAKRK